MERTGNLAGVHIQARLATADRRLAHHVDITVYGPDDALSGSGWVTTLAGTDGSGDGGVASTSRCLFSQRGVEVRGVVRLTGVTLHSSHPQDVDRQITTEADMSTGVVRVTAEAINGIPALLEGIGAVIATRSTVGKEHA